MQHQSRFLDHLTPYPIPLAQKAAFLAGVFGDGSEVAYPKFLSWSTPGPDGLAASGRYAGAGVEPRNPPPWTERGHRRTTLDGASNRDERRTAMDNAQEDIIEDDEAELKIRTALHRMGEENGVSRAWREFERMDPGGRRGGVREQDLVEVSCSVVLDHTERKGEIERFGPATLRQRDRPCVRACR